MKRGWEILVGVDGSAESDAAVAWAVAEARARGCGLIVLHACESRYYGLWTTTRTLRAGLRAMAQPLVDDAIALAARLDAAVPVRGNVLVASPTRTLLRLSTRVPLIVVGRSGRGAISRLLLGSVTRHLMANSSCPVVAVGCPPETDDVGTFGRVVAVVDTSSGNQQTLRFAFDEAHIRNAPVHVLYPMRPSHQPAAEQHMLAGALIRVQAEYPAVAVTSLRKVDSVANVLASVCKSRDLLVLGHHRRGTFTPHTLEADVIDALHAAPCPVAVVHEPSEATVTASGDVLADRASAHKVGQLGAAPASSSYARSAGPSA